MKLTVCCKSQRGFSLVELLVAITLLAIGLLAVAQMQSVAMNANRISHRLTVASSLAQEVMEEIMSRYGSDAIFDANAVNAVYDLDPATPNTFIQFPDSGRFTATYNLTRDNPVAGAASITVNIQRDGVQAVSFNSFKRYQ